MAAGLAPPKRVFAHGWWTNEGEKISKSLGNVIDPYQLIETYGLEQTRYFLLRGVPVGNDGDFSVRSMVHRMNGDLANDLGNLAQRVLSFVAKHAGGAVPAILFNTPGTPDALTTTLDGYPMTRRGKAFKALRVAHFSSVSGDSFSDIVLFVGAPFLAIMVESYLDLPEKAALILLSLCFIAAIVGKPVAKGLIAVGLGLFVATIGTGEDFYPRLTGNILELSGGFPIACVILGTLVIGEVCSALFAMRGEIADQGRLERHEVSGDNSLPLAEKRRLLRYILPSALLGTAIGALRRMEQLIQEAVVTVPRALIAETIDLIAVLVRDAHGRRLAELARVEGRDAATGDYRLTPLPEPQPGDLP